MGRCRRCRCTKYDWGPMQQIAYLNATLIDAATAGFSRLFVGSPQLKLRCICGHHANDHY